MTNRADELSRFEKGEDFASSNESQLGAGSTLEVEVKKGNGELSVLPVDMPVARRLDLLHSSTDLLMAQITEDPQMTVFSVPNVGRIETGKSRAMTAMTRNQNREQLVWFGIDSSNMAASMGDRVIIRRDLLESEYVCKSCKGKGHTDEICPLCEGKQQKEGIVCKNCAVLGFDADAKRPSGNVRCVQCQGSGWRNGIIIPEVAQGKPVTGVVVSIGPDSKFLKLGDRVLHSKFAGHTLEMKSETYTFLREHEIISLLRDLA